MTIDLNHEERVHLARLVAEVLDDWRLEADVQIHLLGLPDSTRPRQMTKFKAGNTPFPDNQEMIQRARHILGIQNSLHVIFAQNPHMPRFWLTNPNNRHFGEAPLGIMMDEGLNGMGRVWGHLDCTQNWE